MSTFVPALRSLKNAIFADTADGRDLTRMGYNNYGIPRPLYDPKNDDLYRNLFPKCGLSEKVTVQRIVELLEVFLGEKYVTTINSISTSVTEATTSAAPILTDTSLALVPSTLQGLRLVDAKDQEWIIISNTAQSFSLRYRSPVVASTPTVPAFGPYTVTKTMPRWEVCNMFPGQIVVDVLLDILAGTPEGSTFLQFPDPVTTTPSYYSFQDTIASSINALDINATVSNSHAGVDLLGILYSGISLTQYFNYTQSHLSAAVTSGLSTFSVTTGEGNNFPTTPASFGAVNFYELVLDDPTTGINETVTIRNRTGDTFTVVGTVAFSYTTATTVTLKILPAFTSNELKPSALVGPTDIQFPTTPAHYTNDAPLFGAPTFSQMAQFPLQAGTGTQTPVGDFFTAKNINHTLSTPLVSPGDTSCVLTGSAGFPLEGYFTFTDTAAGTHETRYCLRSGNTLTIQSVLDPPPTLIPNSFQNAYPAATTRVTYTDLAASVNEPSSLTTNNNAPIILGDFSGALLFHLEQFMKYVKASGIEFKVRIRTL